LHSIEIYLWNGFLFPSIEGLVSIIGPIDEELIAFAFICKEIVLLPSNQRSAKDSSGFTISRSAKDSGFITINEN